MYLVASDIWSFMVAASAASAALYIPEERRNTTSGQIITRETAWLLTGFSLMYTILLYAFVLLFLARDRSLAFGYGRRGEGRPTGLQHSASSIAGLAEVFRDSETRKLVEGVDALESEQALEMQRSMIGKTNFLFRNWQGEAATAVAKPVHEDLQHLAAGAHAIPSLRTDINVITKLRYGELPAIAWAGIPVLLATIVLAIVTLWFLILSKQKEFVMWHQMISTESFSRAEIGAQAQKVLFTSLPTLAMTLISLWWAHVDSYIRRTQPYKVLAKGGIGRDTVLLDYMHNWNVTIPFRALRKRHWELSYVTLVSLIMRVGTLLCAGIFEMSEMPLGKREAADVPQDWRDTTFLNNSTDQFAHQVRAMALSRAVYGYPDIPGWQSGPYVFPSVRLDDDSSYTLSLSGLLATLDCMPAEMETERQIQGPGWLATLKQGDCAGATWPSACNLSHVEPDSKVSSETVQDGQCMAWKYLNSSTCQQPAASGPGRWWIMGLSGPISIEEKTFSDSPSTKPISLLCTPPLFMDTVLVDIDTPGNPGLPSLSIISSPTKQENIPHDRWKNSGHTFETYVSNLIDEHLAGELQLVSDGTYLDKISSIAALNQTSSTKALFNLDTLAASASHTFSVLVATVVSIDQSGAPGNHTPSTALLALTTGTASTVPNVLKIQVARLNRIPLLAGFAALCIFAISIPCAWPSKARRTPNDVSYAANVLALIYDSGLMGLVGRGNMGEVENVRFVLGEFAGISGRRRLGVYVVGRGDAGA